MKILKKLWSFISKIFEGLEKEAKTIVPEIINVVTKVKNFVDSPECDFLTDVIPGELDNTTQNILKEWLPKLLDLLNKVESIALIEDQNERMKAIIKSIQSSDKDTRDITFQPLAAKLVEKIIGTPYGKSAILAEGVYQNPEILA